MFLSTKFIHINRPISTKHINAKEINKKKHTSLAESSEEYGRTKLTVSFEGIDDGAGGRGLRNDDGVLGGSMFGTTFAHDAANAAAESVTDAAAGASDDEKRRSSETAERERRATRRKSMACDRW